MSYSVKRGDTLTAIARNNRTTVAALMKANPQIKNANAISVGAKLTLPGSSDSFQAPKAAPATSVAKPKAAAASSGSNPASVAAQYLGQNISALKVKSGIAKDLDKWPANTVCCANFVSACLQETGQISASQHNDSVAGLSKMLAKDPKFEKVSLKNAKPGDVVCFNVPGEGVNSHTEIYAGMKNGKPQFIGSNNVNRDGTQRISQGSVSYPINAIYHYVG